MAIRLGIVEDDPLLLSGLKAVLGAEHDIELACADMTGREILTHARENLIDVALLDIHLGAGPTGIEIARKLREFSPKIQILFLSSVRDPRFVGIDPSMVPGGSRYLIKDDLTDMASIAEEIRDLYSNGLLTRKPLVPKSPLTASQIEILRLVAQGHSNSTIATERFVTERAVEGAIARLAKHLGLREKPGSNQRVNLARTYFRQMGWDR